MRLLIKHKYVRRWRGPDGKWRYEYPRDRKGRGPKLKFQTRDKPMTTVDTGGMTQQQRAWWTPEFWDKVNQVKQGNSTNKNTDQVRASIMRFQGAAEWEIEDALNAFSAGEDQSDPTAVAIAGAEVINGLIDKEPIAVLIPADDRKAVKGIESSGRLKSQHETGTSRGVTDMRLRQYWERQIVEPTADASTSDRNFAKVYDTFAAEEKPVYGLVRERSGLDRARNYGNVALILHDSVKERCTFTYGNSSGTPGAFTKGNAHVAIDFEKRHPQFVRTSMYGFSHIGRTSFVGEPDIREYIETQIWGGIDVASDVKEIHIAPSNPNFYDDLAKQVDLPLGRDAAKSVHHFLTPVIEGPGPPTPGEMSKFRNMVYTAESIEAVVDIADTYKKPITAADGRLIYDPNSTEPLQQELGL